MKNNLLTLFIGLFLSFGLFQFTNCTSKKSIDNTHSSKKYSFYVMMKNEEEYIVQTDSIQSGFINPAKEGAKVVPQRIFYELIPQNNHYYRLDWKNGLFLQNTIEGNSYKSNDSVRITGNWGIDSYLWKHDTLLTFGHNSKNGETRYAKITFNPLKASEGSIPLPAPSDGFNAMTIGFATFLNNHLYLGYTYHTTTLSSYTTSDTLYIAELTYPKLNIIRTFKDTRSTYPGGINTRQSHYFTDENGDFYFIACPGIAAGNNLSKPTGIFRINKTDGALDRTYFFNLSASPIHNHGYGFWYIGHGKAIVRTERRKLFKGMEDHYLVPHFDFYVLNLKKQTVFRLPLPLDKGTARNCILVENGLVYIALNPNNERSGVWIYNPTTEQLQKGVTFDKDVDYLLRMERLNP